MADNALHFLAAFEEGQRSLLRMKIVGSTPEDCPLIAFSSASVGATFVDGRRLQECTLVRDSDLTVSERAEAETLPVLMFMSTREVQEYLSDPNFFTSLARTMHYGQAKTVIEAMGKTPNHSGSTGNEL